MGHIESMLKEKNIYEFLFDSTQIFFYLLLLLLVVLYIVLFRACNGCAMDKTRMDAKWKRKKNLWLESNERRKMIFFLGLKTTNSSTKSILFTMISILLCCFFFDPAYKMDNLSNISFGSTTSRILFTVCKMYKIVELKSMKFESQPNDTGRHTERARVWQNERAEENTQIVWVIFHSANHKTRSDWCHWPKEPKRNYCFGAILMGEKQWKMRWKSVKIPFKAHDIHEIHGWVYQNIVSLFFHHCKCHVTNSKTADFNPVLAFLISDWIFFCYFQSRQTISKCFWNSIRSNYHRYFFYS